MLFLQGTRDALADAALIAAVAERSARARRCASSTTPTTRSTCAPRRGRTDAQTLAALLDALRDWIDALP